MSKASYLEEAQEIIQAVQGKPLTLEERKSVSIELASFILREANRIQTFQEKKEQRQLAKLMADPLGKAFTVAFTDEGFRSFSPKRIASQLVFLLERYGIPKYFSWLKKLQLHIFKLFAKVLPSLLIPLVKLSLRRQTVKVILPGEPHALEEHIRKRTKEGVRLNLNHLGEAILSEQEANRRLELYLHDLKNPLINYVSIKISTIYSQIHLIGWEKSLEKIAENLRKLYRAAMQNPEEVEGEKKNKFVNLDMEEYKDLHLTVEVFKKVLSEPEFYSLSAGIVLQAYLPDSFALQQDLTSWAKKRIKGGGAPIKIRIVKGANLSMEQFEASLREWEQAPYLSKIEVDANYKRMLEYGCLAENARAVHLGIATHNVFDIAYAILLREEYGVSAYTIFEMLEGMADPIRRTVQELTGEVLLYCPVARKEDFQHAIAYLIRRLDENTGSENFLRHLFHLTPGSVTWEEQANLFLQSCEKMETVAAEPRREQNRNLPPLEKTRFEPFANEADTDFSLPQNQKWAEALCQKYKKKTFPPLPLCIGGKELFENEKGEGVDPSKPSQILFRYMLGDLSHVETAIVTAKKAEQTWKETPYQKRSELLHKAATLFRKKRGEFLGLMMANTGKVFLEGDSEFSEAIDNLVYYQKQLDKLHKTPDLQFEPKGTVLVAPPWNFPVAIPLGGITAALLTGNCVLFKPAPEAVLVGWHIAQTLWEAGISKEVLQFINVPDDPEGSALVKNPAINCVVLTGATQTAERFLKMRPDLDLCAETGGKNAMILTDLCDRDLAIKDLLQSAFGHAGQKCSATSLAILEQPLYDNPHFLRQLREAASSLTVGSACGLNTKISPLIRPPNENLYKGLTELEEGEEWLLEPKVDPENPYLWSPGIKLGVKLNSFTQKTELFGPVLGLMKARNLQQAIDFANSTEYGLTSGLHSLDEREQLLWIKQIEAGNLYINRTMTGAIVKRQPFGGCKKSSFGKAFKAGGPNYLLNFYKVKQTGLAQEKAPVNESVNELTYFLEKLDLSKEELGEWYLAISNYSFWWQKMKARRDPTKIIGQDNYFYYVPKKPMMLRASSKDHPLDFLKICAAALTCNPHFELSWNPQEKKELDLTLLSPKISVIEEEEKTFLKRLERGDVSRVRLAHKATSEELASAALSGTHLADDPPLLNGRIELLHYVREVSLSFDYHRYGNLGLREDELRKPIN